MTDEVRDAVAAAFAAHEEPNETPAEEVPTEENQEPEVKPENTPVEPSPSEPVDQASDTEVPEAAKEPEAPETPKFLPAEEVEDDTPAESTDSQEPAVPAPVAWRGEAKQHWANLPREVQEEAIRREGEVNRVLRESAESRHNWKQFEDMVQPFQSIMAAEGVDALTATRNLMQVSAGLRLGTPQQKAALVAQIVRNYGVDINALDSAISGQAPAQGGTPDINYQVQQALDQRLAPVQQWMGDQQAREQEQIRQQQVQVDSEIEAFANDPQHPFFEDVREDMAVLLDTASQSGRSMTLDQAYQAALTLNPKLSSLEQRRQQAVQAKKNGQTIASKKRAAASVASSSPPETTTPPTTVRGAVEAAFAKHGA